MNYKGWLVAACFIGLLAMDFAGPAFFFLFVAAIYYVAKEFMSFAVTDPLAWEERQRQKRHGGKALLDEVKQDLSRTKAMLKQGDREKAMVWLNSLEKKVVDYTGPLDSTQEAEHQLISEFRISNDLIKSSAEMYGGDCAWCYIKSDSNIYECPACDFVSTSKTSVKGLLKHWKNKHPDCEFPAHSACNRHSMYTVDGYKK